MSVDDKPKVIETPGTYGCSISRTLGVIGDAWGFLVLRSAFFGARRFEDFVHEVAASRGIISKRLDRFVADEIIERRPYSSRPVRHEYRLTEKGRAMYPIFVAMMQWGDRWTDWPDGPPLVLTHRTCGARLGAVAVCSECDRRLVPAEVEHMVRDPQALRAGPTQKRLRRATNPQSFLHGRECSVARTLMQFGDRWSFLILRDAFLGKRRYDEFQKELGIASNILSDRLQSLCDAGVLDKSIYQTGPERFEYHLSERGLDLYPSLLAMIAWGDAWIFGATQRPVELFHRSCEATMRPLLVCETCRVPLNPRDVDYAYVRPQKFAVRLLGQSGAADRASGPVESRRR